MTADNSTTIHYVESNADEESGAGDRPIQVLEVQMFYQEPTLAGVSGHILHETEPILYDPALFDLPLRYLNDDPTSLQIYIAGLLHQINIDFVSSEIIAAHLVSYLLQITGDNRYINFHTIAVFDDVPVYDAPQIQVPELSIGAAIGEENPASAEAQSNLEENHVDEDLGICWICLDEISCEEGRVVKIPCGHVYHKQCVFLIPIVAPCVMCRRSLLPCY